MTEATTKLFLVLSEERGGPWEAGPELTKKNLTDWLGEQEDRVDELKERIERKQGELARLAEVKEADVVPDQALTHLETAFRFNQGQDISQIEERRPLGRLHNGEGERPQRLPNSGRRGRTGDGLVRTSTPAGREDRASRVGVESFLRLSGREEEELEERQRLREQASRD